MKLGMIVGYSGRKMNIPLDAIRHAENLGYDSVWTSEAYGSDAITPATWILANTTKIKVGTAIIQMPARTPSMAAMTAMSLAQLSNNRFIVGVGASGPQVIEGWHGVPYGKPVTRLKEYVQVMKQIFARQGVTTRIRGTLGVLIQAFRLRILSRSDTLSRLNALEGHPEVWIHESLFRQAIQAVSQSPD